MRATAMRDYPQQWHYCSDERGGQRGRKSGARAPVTYHKYNQGIHEVGETMCGASHVQPSGTAALHDGHRRVTTLSMSILANIA